MRIIHLSDTHFGNSSPAFSVEDLKHALNGFKSSFRDADTYMIISGDITFKGNPDGYKQAQNFINETWLINGGARDRFLACPGNHYLCNGNFLNFH